MKSIHGLRRVRSSFAITLSLVGWRGKNVLHFFFFFLLSLSSFFFLSSFFQLHQCAATVYSPERDCSRRHRARWGYIGPRDTWPIISGLFFILDFYLGFTFDLCSCTHELTNSNAWSLSNFPTEYKGHESSLTLNLRRLARDCLLLESLQVRRPIKWGMYPREKNQREVHFSVAAAACQKYRLVYTHSQSLWTLFSFLFLLPSFSFSRVKLICALLLHLPCTLFLFSCVRNSVSLFAAAAAAAAVSLYSILHSAVSVKSVSRKLRYDVRVACQNGCISIFTLFVHVCSLLSLSLFTHRRTHELNEEWIIQKLHLAQVASFFLSYCIKYWKCTAVKQLRLDFQLQSSCT